MSDIGTHRTTANQAAHIALGATFLGIMLFPVYWMVNVSLQGDSGAALNDLFPTDPTLQAYRQAITEQGSNLVTSMVIALGTVAVTLVVATPAAYALAAFRLRWTAFVVFGLLVTQMIPGIVIANALYAAYNDLGLLDSYTGLVLANASHAIPFAILILRAFMGSIPPSLVEAAWIDGAGHLRAFLSIVVPVSRNSIITAALFSFLFGWSDFLFALTLTSSDRIRTVTLGIFTYLGPDTQDWGPVMATSVLAALPAVVLLVGAQRYIAAGALGGSIK